MEYIKPEFWTQLGHLPAHSGPNNWSDKALMGGVSNEVDRDPR